MKKSGIGKKRCIALAAAVLAFFGDATAAWAGTETINGVTWSFSAYDGCARVSRASGAGDDLVIPGSLGGYPVTIIESRTFEGYGTTKSVTIPASVTNIGMKAFYGCSSLTAVYIHDLAAWCGITFAYGGNPLGSAGHLYLDNEEVRDLVIPNGVARIGNIAFDNCAGLTSLTIPDSVTSIGSEAFATCGGLTNITLGGGLRDIGYMAFQRCSGLTEVTIPGGVVNLDGYIFYECNGLTNVTIERGVASVGEGMFRSCGQLRNVRLPDSITNIGNGAFASCTNLTSMAIPSSVTRIGDWAFQYCTGLENVSIGKGVTDIGAEAFSSCVSLTSVTIPDGVLDIGASAFYWCSGLEHVELGNGVRNIGDSAFQSCSSLESLTIPASVTNLGSSVFYESGLKTLYVPASWEGTAMLDGTGVPSGCKVVYGSGEDEATTTTPVAVPHAWLEAEAPGILAAAGGDYEAAAMVMASNGVSRVWECYLQGVPPEDAEESFRLLSRVEDGEVVLWWEPNLGTARSYALEGVENMGDEWGETNAATRFYRARVSMP